MIDLWNNYEIKYNLRINIKLDYEQQTLSIIDNAGGVDSDNLNLLVSPGRSSTELDSNSIRYFGVGSKRAVVAISHDVEIRTRKRGENKTYKLKIDRDWIASEDWGLTAYEVPNIDEGETIIDMTRLTRQLNEESTSALKKHLEAV